MYAPDRRSSSYELNAWASSWLTREGGWESRAYELANFDPIRFNEICESCTVYDVAKAWKTKMALSEFAWSDVDARTQSIKWV